MNLNVGEGDQRRELLHQVGMNLPELTSTSDWITRTFSDSEQLSTNEFHALVVIAMANAGSAAMTPSTLRTQIGLSGAAITYVVQRLCESGYVRRGSDPRDRRKVVLRLTERGDRVVKDFSEGIAAHMHQTLADLPDDALERAHRTFQVMITSMKDFRTAATAVSSSAPGRESQAPSLE